jgi:hypothetical protein
MCLQFGFEIFWRKDFGAKAAHKMLVKLTPGCQAEMLPGKNVNNSNNGGTYLDSLGSITTHRIVLFLLQLPRNQGKHKTQQN